MDLDVWKRSYIKHNHSFNAHTTYNDQMDVVYLLSNTF